MAGKIRRLLQRGWVCFLLLSGALWWAKRQLRRRGAIVVLTFHRVLSDAERRLAHSLPGIIVRQETFEQLVRHAVREYQPVSLQGAVPGTPGGKVQVAFTFDDGWADNFSTAFPIAGGHGLPLTIFICPGLVGVESPFWPERVIALLGSARPHAGEAEIEALVESLKHSAPEESARFIESLSGPAGPPQLDGDNTLSWEQAAAMSRAGVTYGSHTQTHQILTTVPPDEARREVRESKAAIERELGTRCDLFAYPNGDWSVETRRILAEEGFRLAFITERGAWTATCDRLAIPRANVSEDNIADLTGRFSPAMFEYTSFWKVWRATKRKLRLQTARAQQAATLAKV